MNSSILVLKLWNYCNVLRDDGMELWRLRRAAHLPAVPEDGGRALALVFNKAQNKFQDPAKLRRVIVDLIDKENWSALSADVKGDAYEGLLEKNAQDLKSGAGQYFTQDDSLADSDNLPPPDVIAQEIVDDLEAALEQFRLIAGTSTVRHALTYEQSRVVGRDRRRAAAHRPVALFRSATALVSRLPAAGGIRRPMG